VLQRCHDTGQPLSLVLLVLLEQQVLVLEQQMPERVLKRQVLVLVLPVLTFSRHPV
jgi:hypothetical protein